MPQTPKIFLAHLPKPRTPFYINSIQPPNQEIRNRHCCNTDIRIQRPYSDFNYPNNVSLLFGPG